MPQKGTTILSSKLVSEDPEIGVNIRIKKNECVNMDSFRTSELIVY